MSIPLEDQFEDVVGKAQRGLRLQGSALAQRAGVSADEADAFAEGGAHLQGKAADELARALGLNLPALRALDGGNWHPGDVRLPATTAAFNGPFGGMTVNSYLVWDREGGSAAAFDTGGDCGALLETLHAHHLTLTAIFLTHTHEDHIADLDRLTADTKAPVYVSAFERFPGAQVIQDGQMFSVGSLTVTAHATPGHSPGGLTYVVTGLEPTLVVVGDALFSASMGGVGPEKYAGALAANRTHIFSLPDEAVVFPGHGPVTTVGLERVHNPFYAGTV